MYDTSYATYGTSSNPAAIITSVFSSGISIIISLGYTLLTIASLWKIFEKFGKEGWKSIIPIYNIIVLFEIVEMKAWYVALALIPCVGPFILMIFVIIAYAKIAKKLGKEGAFVLLIIFFTPIALALLAFGKNNEISNNNQNVQNDPMNNMNNQNIMGTNEMPQQPVFNQPVAPTVPNNEQMAQPMNNDFVSAIPVEPVAPVVPETQPMENINSTVEQPASETAITEPVIEEQTPIAPPQEPTPVEPVAPVAEPVVEPTPAEPIQPVVEPVAPVAEPAVEPTPVEPVAPVAQTPVVETPATESTVDPLQNIEPPVIPTITDDNNNNIQ